MKPEDKPDFNSIYKKRRRMNWPHEYVEGGGCMNMVDSIDAMTEAWNLAIDQCNETATIIKTGNSGSYFDAPVDKQSILKNKIE